MVSLTSILLHAVPHHGVRRHWAQHPHLPPPDNPHPGACLQEQILTIAAVKYKDYIFFQKSLVVAATLYTVHLSLFSKGRTCK
jgi:hypothetical protein